MSRHFRKPPSQRQLRVGEEVRHAMARILGEAHFRDPDLQDVSITVSEARASPDLKSVTIFVMPLGGRDVPVTVAALNRASAYLRGELARAVQLRAVPAITFAADDSFDTGGKIDRLLNDERVRRDLTRDADETPEDGSGGA
jgi:ribosome-binding factor A